MIDSRRRPAPVPSTAAGNMEADAPTAETLVGRKCCIAATPATIPYFNDMDMHYLFSQWPG
jgi:hypothetical protein